MNKKTRKLFTWCLVVCMVVVQMLFANVAFAATSYAGADRYQTALKVVQAGWTTSDNAVIARGDDLADALAAAPLAYAKGKAPILLTETGALPTGVMEELTALGVKNVYIVGGTGAVSSAVETALAAKFTVKRLWGADRAATSLAVAKEAFPTAPAKAVMVNGYAVADALSISSIAANLGMPILLVDKDAMSADIAAYLTGKSVYAVGGTGVISDTVASNATRLFGADRYATNVAVLTAFTLDYSKVFVAVGEDANSVDALGGAALAAKGNNPMVLVNGALTPAASDLLKGKVTKDSKVFTLGGVVPASVATAVEALVPVDQTLAVKSVSANNLLEINVEFNKPVDETSAEVTGNYTLSAGAVSSAVLNGNTVTLTLTAKAAQQASIDVTVANVKDVAGNKITTVTKTVTMLDVTVPTVTGVTVTGPTTLKVAYSEPIDAANIGTFTVDNNTYSVSALASGTDNHAVNLTLGTTLSDGNHTVTVTGTKDVAGFAVAKVDVPFTYATDKAAPTVSLVSASQNQVKIKFNKPITAGTQGYLSVYHTYNNNVVYVGTPVWNADGQNVTVTFASNYLPLGNATVYVNAGTGTNLLADAWGNKFASATLTAAITADATAPVVKSVTAIDSTHIDVQYSETVTGANFAANYTLKDVNDTAVAVSSAVVDGTDNTLYHLTTAQMVGGSYTLAIANIKDTSIAQNAMAAYSTTVAVKDAVPPTVGTAVTNAGDATATKILLTYSEAMATTGAASVLDANNYIFNGAALPTGTTLTSSNNGKTVLLTFPAAATLTGKNLIVGHVADAAGNFVAAMSTTVGVTTDAISTINSAKAINVTTVTFEVYSPLSAIDVSKFTVATKAAATATYVNQKVNNGTVDGALVTLTVASGDKWLPNATPAIAALAGAFKTVFGTSSSAILATNAADKVVPTLVSAEVTGPSTITLTYDESIKISSVSVYTYTVANNTVTATNVAANVVTLTLGTALTGTDATASVTQALEVQDAAGNKLAPSAAVDVTDAQLPTFTASITGTKQITVVFSEAVSKADAETIGNYVYKPAGAGEAIVSATLQADNKTVIIVTTTAPSAGTSTIDATVEDLEGNTSASAAVTL